MATPSKLGVPFNNTAMATHNKHLRFICTQLAKAAGHGISYGLQEVSTHLSEHMRHGMQCAVSFSSGVE